MVHDCIENKSEFGMLLVAPKGLVRVGCTAEVLDVANRYPDGRMDIVAVGRAPFRIVELMNAKEYEDGMLLEGTVDYLDDRERSVDAQKRRELVQHYEVCHTIVYGDYPRNIQGLEPDELSYAIAGTLPMDLMWKQQVLELRSEADRQERLLTYLREWAPHLQKIESQRQHAEGNGSAVN
jgi:Lon protease-like protein